jgi:hypothetical protein
MVIRGFVKLDVAILFVHCPVRVMISLFLYNVVSCCVGADAFAQISYHCNTPLHEPNNNVVLGAFETVGLQPCR